jgi:hypothetical protein
MNIIEHAWEKLDRRVQARKVLKQNCDELRAALPEEWANLDDSSPRRVQPLLFSQNSADSKLLD